MTGLNADDLEIIKDILGPDEDDDPIFGRRKNDDNKPQSHPKTNISFGNNDSSPTTIPHAGELGSHCFHTSQDVPAEPSGPLTKCTSICLGGPDLPSGMTTEAGGPRFCSVLSCISCDFNVLRFNDRRWKKSTDYLFLRNNFPDKVQQNLVLAPGWCAYCCQCTFCEENETRKLSSFSSNWVCRGHR